MGNIKGSAFNFGDQGVFHSVLDYGARTTKADVQNDVVIAAALTAIAADGGGVLVIPQGIANTFDPATDFPATANPLMVLVLTGNKFQVWSNQDITAEIAGTLASLILTAPQAISYRIIDADPATYTYKFEVYDNAGTPVITGSSFDLCFFLPGGVNPIAAFSRSGAKQGALYLFNGLDVTGTLTHNGQNLGGKSIQAPAAGGSIQIADNTPNLILNHAATIATLTITLPQNPVDGNVVRIFSRSIVTTLTLNAGAGETIETGHTITTLAAAASVEYQFNSSDSKWYRLR